MKFVVRLIYDNLDILLGRVRQSRQDIIILIVKVNLNSINRMVVLSAPTRPEGSR